MRRTGIVLAAVAAAAVVGWVLLARTPTSTPTVSAPHADAETASARSVHTVRFGVPVGWSHDEAGARDAAVSAVSLTGAIAKAGFVTRADMIRTLASVRFAPTLIESSASQLSVVLGDLGGAGITADTVVFREFVLSASVDHVTPVDAAVRVWSVVVAGAPGRGAPRQLWRTVSVELVWEAGDWRVDGWSSTSGPTPALATGVPVAPLDEMATVVAWPSLGGA